MKVCFKCEDKKPLSEYYRHGQMADGHLNKCKECTKRDSWERRHNSDARGRILEYDRRRGSRQGYEYTRDYRERNNLKYKAHSAVSREVGAGRIVKPKRCQHCKQKCRVEGHHEDYSKPLDVVWLCSACHKNLHAMYESVGRVIGGAG